MNIQKLLSLSLILLLMVVMGFGSGCQAEREVAKVKEEDQKVKDGGALFSLEQEVNQIMVYQGDAQPSATFQQADQVEEIINILKTAHSMPEDAIYTMDYYRDLTLELADDSIRKLSFNKGGGSVFVDQLRGETYGLSMQAKQRLHELIAAAESE